MLCRVFSFDNNSQHVVVKLADTHIQGDPYRLFYYNVINCMVRFKISVVRTEHNLRGSVESGYGSLFTRHPPLLAKPTMLVLSNKYSPTRNSSALSHILLMNAIISIIVSMISYHTLSWVIKYKNSSIFE
uniref:Uncharacterized protein n=1 Tax=Cacopsylla melanoneura TaxID=428564 RepID=A0A8D8U4P8_9HEMI